MLTQSKQRSSTTVQAADGCLMTLAAPGWDLTRTWDSTVRIRSGRPDGRRADNAWMREIHIAPSGNIDFLLENFLDARVTQRLVARGGGTFLIAESRQADLQGVALWRGEWHEAVAYLSPSEMGVGSRPLRVFEGLGFIDSPRGLRIVPGYGRETHIQVMDVSTYVEGAGEIEIGPAAEALQMVPTWSGAQVRGGEVWRVDTTLDEDAGAQHGLMMASRSAVLTLTPDDPSNSRLTKQLDFMQSISQVTWEKSGTSSKGVS